MQNNYKKTKYSYGVACCKVNDDGKLEILLIYKRFTYAFNTFVHGRYNPNKQEELISLFGGMTNEEKFDILSLKFLQIWYRVWLNNIHQSAAFYSAKAKFERTFLRDNGARLRDLIQKSKSSNKIWEIPKGRKKIKEEENIHCAVREFAEETGLQKHQYKLLSGFTINDIYVDAGIRYINTYYAAIVPRNIIVNPSISFKQPGQVCEVLDVRWFSIEQMRFLDTNCRAKTLTRSVFNYVKKQL